MATKSSKEKAHQSAADKAAKNAFDIRSRRQFAESNSLHRQVKLLAAGCMPWCKDKVSSALRLLRSSFHSLREMMGSIRVPAGVQICAFLIVSVAISMIAAFSTEYTTGTTLSYNGVELAYTFLS